VIFSTFIHVKERCSPEDAVADLTVGDSSGILDGELKKAGSDGYERYLGIF